VVAVDGALLKRGCCGVDAQRLESNSVACSNGCRNGGHLENPEREAAKRHAVITSCLRLGIYVIVDWHDHKANEHKEEAKVFFNDMARAHGKHPNVLFETSNEPVQQSWPGETKPYHEEMVSVVRHHTDNLIICGTPKWSQDVDVASSDPVEGKTYHVRFTSMQAPMVKSSGANAEQH